MTIRPRRQADHAGLERLARHVRETDGYPVHVPDGDHLAFVADTDALAAWVAVCDGSVVGHVALHREAYEPVLELFERATGLRRRCAGVVARLLVSPATRRQGIGRLLLDAAVTDARRRRRLPVLDVVASHTAAIGLYEATGWELLGAVSTRMAEDLTVDELVYWLPDPRGVVQVRPL